MRELGLLIFFLFIGKLQPKSSQQKKQPKLQQQQLQTNKQTANQPEPLSTPTYYANQFTKYSWNHFTYGIMILTQDQ